MAVTHKAQPYVAGTPDTEVIGAAMIAFLQNLRSEAVLPILKKYDAENIEEDKWYPHQLWLDILRSLEEDLGGGVTEVFVAFGKQVVQSAVMPPEIKTIEDVLNSLHGIHHANLRNANPEEGYYLDQKGEKNYIVFQNTPNPDSAIYGFLWGLVARFKDEDEVFVVKQIERTDDMTYPGTPFELRWWFK